MTAVGSLLHAMRTRGRRRAAALPAAGRAPARPRLSPSVVPLYVRRATIHTLAVQGLSCEEIVRRTGFAYDAVAMLVSPDGPRRAQEVRP